jgi:transposase
MWCIPKVTPEFIVSMEEVLNIYALPYNPKEPVLCFDEKSKELHTETRTPTNTAVGKVRRRDYEYKRNGTCNVFMMVEPKGGYRSAVVTGRRTRVDFGEEIKRIVTLPRYKKATAIHIVLDNLNTHNAQSLVEAFGEKKTQKLMQRIVFHHTPKHASWLNMAEIELSIMERQCTKGRIGDMALLTKKLLAWQTRRNEMNATINWKFSVQDAKKVFKYDAGKLC